MIRDPPLDQCLLKQGLAPGPGDRKCAGKLRTVVCLDRPDRKRRRFDRPLRKVFGADGTVLRIHFPVCPARAFVLCCEPAVFFRRLLRNSRAHALRPSEHFARGTRPAGLVLSRPALLPVPHKPASRSLEAAAASFVSVCAGLFIPQRQVAPILSSISPDRSFLFCRLLPRKATRCARPVLQAFQRPTISLLPFAHGLSTWPVPVRRCAGSLVCRVFQRPLTIVGCLCYLVLGELLRGGGLFALLSCHCRVLFCVAAVTYVYCTATVFSFSLRCKAMIP